MKKWLLAAGLGLAMVTSAQAADKIALVNMNSLFQQVAQKTGVSNTLENEFKGRASELQRMEGDLQSKMQRLQSMKPRAPSPHDGKMKKALRYIDAHLSDELRLEDVAAHVYLSPYYFSKLFKKYQGIGFNAWVNQQRMASAKELLCHSDWSIASIARNLGFSQTSYFCKVFRQTYQVTPQAFRQQINAGSQTESF